MNGYDILDAYDKKRRQSRETSQTENEQTATRGEELLNEYDRQLRKQAAARTSGKMQTYLKQWYNDSKGVSGAYSDWQKNGGAGQSDKDTDSAYTTAADRQEDLLTQADWLKTRLKRDADVYGQDEVDKIIQGIDGILAQNTAALDAFRDNKQNASAYRETKESAKTQGLEVADPYTFYWNKKNGNKAMEQWDSYADYLGAVQENTFQKGAYSLAKSKTQEQLENALSHAEDTFRENVRQEGKLMQDIAAIKADPYADKSKVSTLEKQLEQVKSAIEQARSDKKTISQSMEYRKSIDIDNTRTKSATQAIEKAFAPVTNEDVDAARAALEEAKTRAQSRDAQESMRAQNEIPALTEEYNRLFAAYEDYKAGGDSERQKMLAMSDEDKVAYAYSKDSPMFQADMDYLGRSGWGAGKQVGYLVQKGYSWQDIETMAQQMSAQSGDRYQNKNELLAYVNQTNASDAKAEMMQELYGDSFLAKAAGTVASVPLNLVGGVVAFGEDTANQLLGDGLDTGHSVGHFLLDVGDTARAGVSQSIDSGFGRFIYDSMMSTVDSAAAIGLGAATGMPALTLAIMGSGSAARAIQEGKDRGLSDEAAYTTGVLAGMAEVAFEKISLENLKSVKELLDAPASTVEAKIKKTLVQMGVEGSEEVFTDLANAISDQIVNGDKSALMQSIDDNMAQGMNESEAIGQAMKNFAAQIGGSFLGGAFSGGVFAAGANVISRVQRRGMAKAQGAVLNYSGMADAAARFTMEYVPVGSRAYQQAQKVLDKTQNGGTLLARETGTMFRSGVEAYAKQTGRELSGALTQSGLRQTDAKAIADRLMNGEELSVAQADRVRRSDEARAAVSQVLGVDIAKSASANEVAVTLRQAADTAFSVDGLLGSYYDTEQTGAGGANGGDMAAAGETVAPAAEWLQGGVQSDAQGVDSGVRLSDGQDATVWATGEPVTVVGIADVTDGRMEVALSDGETMPLSDLEMGDTALSTLLQAAQAYPTTTARAFVSGYEGTMPLEHYRVAFDYLRQKGAEGADFQQAVKNAGETAARMSEIARYQAYMAGVNEAQTLHSDAESGTINETGGVTYGEETYDGYRSASEGDDPLSRTGSFTGETEGNGQRSEGSRAYETNPREDGAGEDRGAKTTGRNGEGTSVRRSAQSNGREVTYTGKDEASLTKQQRRAAEICRANGRELHFFEQGEEVTVDGAPIAVNGRIAFTLPGTSLIFCMDGQDVGAIYHEMFHLDLAEGKKSAAQLMELVKSRIDPTSEAALFYVKNCLDAYGVGVDEDVVLDESYEAMVADALAFMPEEVSADVRQYAYAGSPVVAQRLTALFGSRETLDKVAAAAMMWQQQEAGSTQNSEPGGVLYSMDKAGKARRKRKSSYDEFASLAMRWANKADRKDGDLTILYKGNRAFLLSASNGNYTVLHKGKSETIQRLRSEYERIRGEKNSVDEDFNAYEAVEQRNNRHMLSSTDRKSERRDRGSNPKSGSESSATRNDESLREDTHQTSEERDGSRGVNQDVRFSMDKSEYSYKAITSKPDMDIAVVSEDVPMREDGKFDRAAIRQMAINSLTKTKGYRYNNGSHQVFVKDTGRYVTVSRKALEHGLEGRKSYTYAVTSGIGPILQNAIRINELETKHSHAVGTYLLLSMAKSDRAFYPVRFVVNQFQDGHSEVEKANVLDVLHASWVKEMVTDANGARSLERESSLAPSVTTISISDLLEKVKSVHSDILPQDVLDHFGMQRSSSVFSNSVRFAMDKVEKSDYARLSKENDKLKRQVESLKKEFQLTHGHQLNQKSIEKLAGKMLRQYSSKYDRATLVSNLSTLFNYIAKGKDVYFDDVMHTATDIAYSVLQESEWKNTELYDQYADMRQYLKEKKISLSDKVKAELDAQYDGYENFRRQNLGSIRFAKNGTPLDVLWGEMSEMWPEFFPEGTLEYEQPFKLVEAVETVKPTIENPYGMNPQEAAADLAMQLFENYFDIPEVRTFADKKQLELTAERIKYGTRIQEMRRQSKERFAERMKQVKQENAQKRQELAKKIRDEQDKKRKDQLKRQYDRLTDSKAKALEKQKAMYEDRSKRQRNQAEIREQRDKIKRAAGRMKNLLINGTDLRHIPEEFRVSVARLLNMLDLSTDRMSENRGLGQVYANLRAAYERIGSENGDNMQRLQARSGAGYSQQCRWRRRRGGVLLSRRRHQQNAGDQCAGGNHQDRAEQPRHQNQNGQRRSGLLRLYPRNQCAVGDRRMRVCGQQDGCADRGDRRQTGYDGQCDRQRHP